MNPCGQDGGQEEVTIVVVDTVTMNEDIAGKYYGCANGMIAVLNVGRKSVSSVTRTCSVVLIICNYRYPQPFALRTVKGINQFVCVTFRRERPNKSICLIRVSRLLPEYLYININIRQRVFIEI